MRFNPSRENPKSIMRRTAKGTASVASAAHRSAKSARSPALDSVEHTEAEIPAAEAWARAPAPPSVQGGRGFPVFVPALARLAGLLARRRSQDAIPPTAGIWLRRQCPAAALLTITRRRSARFSWAG